MSTSLVGHQSHDTGPDGGDQHTFGLHAQLVNGGEVSSTCANQAWGGDCHGAGCGGGGYPRDAQVNAGGGAGAAAPNEPPAKPKPRPSATYLWAARFARIY